MNYKLLLIHNQDTLLNSSAQMPKEVEAAVIEAQEKNGIRVGIITDKSIEDEATIASILKLEEYSGYIISTFEHKVFNCKTKAVFDYADNIIRFFNDKLDLLAEEIIAVSSSASDVFLLQSAGLGVAMAQAGEALKTCADYVTLSNDQNGVAHMLNKYLNSNYESVPITPEEIEAMTKDTMLSTLGMRTTVLKRGYVEMTMPVSKATRQPMGILHGGANLALAETAAGMGSVALLEPGYVQVGMQVSGNHIGRAIEGDTMCAKARIIHKGKTTHVWSVEIYSLQSGKLIHSSRVLNSIIKMR